MSAKCETDAPVISVISWPVMDDYKLILNIVQVIYLLTCLALLVFLLFCNTMLVQIYIIILHIYIYK